VLRGISLSVPAPPIRSLAPFHATRRETARMCRIWAHRRGRNRVFACKRNFDISRHPVHALECRRGPGTAVQKSGQFLVGFARRSESGGWASGLGSGSRRASWRELGLGDDLQTSNNPSYFSAVNAPTPQSHRGRASWSSRCIASSLSEANGIYRPLHATDPPRLKASSLRRPYLGISR